MQYLHPMVFRFIKIELILFLFVNPFIFSSCIDECESDEYGEEINLIIPCKLGEESDTLKLGDTLWIEFNFSKEVEVKNENNLVKLDSFQFFPELFLGEVSSSQIEYLNDPEFVELVGAIEILPLATVVVYPLIFTELDNSYQFRSGVILNRTGLFLAAINPCLVCLERYNHPSLIYCESKKRDLEISFINEFSSQENLEMLTSQSSVESIQNEINRAEEFFQAAGTAFWVVEP
ncbi:MAG: hypothetical protein AAGF87_15015, partial [Bacteroidota bacterium]